MSSIDLIDVVDRIIGEKNLKCVVNLGEKRVFFFIFLFFFVFFFFFF